MTASKFRAARIKPYLRVSSGKRFILFDGQDKKRKTDGIVEPCFRSR